MRIVDSNSEEQPITALSRGRELAIEALQFLTPALGLLLFVLGLSARYPWLSKPWIRDSLIALGILVLIWFAKPRFYAWLRRNREKKRDQHFIAANDARLREFMEQFAEFISNSNTRSLIYIVRSGFSQNMTAAEQILAGDYIGSWFQAYRDQLAFPTRDVPQFLARCREFANIVQQFNSFYVLRAQKQLAAAAANLPEQSTEELEGFREEYNAFVRDLESWSKGIINYLHSVGVEEQQALRLAPTSYFERAKSFGRTNSAGAHTT